MSLQSEYYEFLYHHGVIGRFSNDCQVTYDGATNKYKLELKR